MYVSVVLLWRSAHVRVGECTHCVGSGRILWRSAWRVCLYVPFVFMSGRMSPPVGERAYVSETPLVKEHVHGSVASCGRVRTL